MNVLAAIMLNVTQLSFTQKMLYQIFVGTTYFSLNSSKKQPIKEGGWKLYNVQINSKLDKL